METLNNLISKCVLGNVIFEGQIGHAYTVQELLNSTGKRTLNQLYQFYKKKTKSLGEDSLFEGTSGSRTKRASFELKIDTLKAIFDFVTEREEAEKNKGATREAALIKLAALKSIKTSKDFRAMEDLTDEALATEIATAEALAQA